MNYDRMLSYSKTSFITTSENRFWDMLFAAVLIMVVLLAGIANAATGVKQLSAEFKDPGQESRPRAYWNWLNGAVTHKGLTRDLEEAKDKGMGGLEMWDTEAMRNQDGYVPAGPAFMSSKSVAAMKHCMKEAKRLGLDLGLVTSSGWNAGGPWVPDELASKNLFYSQVAVTGPGYIRHELPFPKVPAKCPKDEDGLPRWYKEVAILAWPETKDKVIADPSKIIDLTDKFKNGILSWEVGKGKWRVMRYVCTNNGQQLIAASPNSKGPFIDFLDPEATRFHFEYIIKKLGIPKGGDPDNPLKSLEVDSMELHEGIQWTPKFPQWFKKQHGYDPIKWLPALSEWTIKDKDTSGKFLYDYKKTVSDLLIFSHYTTGSEVCGEYGLQLAGEAGGPGPPIWPSCPVDSLKALGNVHIPRGEFWIQSPRDIFLIKEIASASHIYGKKYVDAESWTTWRRWKDSPFDRKRLVDRAFCEGLNMITYHGYSHSPKDAGLPGYTYHAGVDMNPQVVWWSKAKPFMDYLSRCCYMLRQGLFVADVAYYYGDQAPNFWPMPHKSPKKTMLKGLGEGYDYDVVNSDVILNRMSVRNGRIVLPDGMSYRVLQVPDQNDMPLEVLVKLEKLVAAGATIIGPKPTDVPGLHDSKAKTIKLREIAYKMWGLCDGELVKENKYGKGKVVNGMTVKEYLSHESIGQDFSCVDEKLQSSLDYIHRRTNDSDIYFVRNKSLGAVKTQCKFRVEDSAPQFWNPVDGNMEPAYVYSKAEGGTNVLLDLPPGGSIFVVFSKKFSSPGIDSIDYTSKDTDPNMPCAEVTAVEGKTATVEFFKNGEFAVTAANGKKKQVKIDSVPLPQTLEGQWDVDFDPKWGAPAKIKLDKLISWTDHKDEGVKYYSGSGFYTKILLVDADRRASKRKIHLDLGDVREIAEVFVNGKSAGVLWKPPFRTDITSLVKPGVNILKVEVMNLWINRLTGDQMLEEKDRYTRTNMSFDGYWSRPEVWRLQPAGLLGPVRLLASESVTIDIDGK